jgi:hypothetical protein
VRLCCTIWGAISLLLPKSLSSDEELLGSHRPCSWSWADTTWNSLVRKTPLCTFTQPGRQALLAWSWMKMPCCTEFSDLTKLSWCDFLVISLIRLSWAWHGNCHIWGGSLSAKLGGEAKERERKWEVGLTVTLGLKTTFLNEQNPSSSSYFSVL